MKTYPFTEQYGYEVDRQLYDTHRFYFYKRGAEAKRSKATPAPVVKLGLRNPETFVSRELFLLIDTGAALSVLTHQSARELGLETEPIAGEGLVGLADAGGHPVVGFRRSITVYLGGAWQRIPVLVGPDQIYIDAYAKQMKEPFASPPGSDILGRTRILANFLLCLDSRRLYAFPRLKRT